MAETEQPPTGTRYRLSSQLAEWDGVEVVWPGGTVAAQGSSGLEVECYVLTGPLAGQRAKVAVPWLVKGETL